MLCRFAAISINKSKILQISFSKNAPAITTITAHHIARNLLQIAPKNTLQILFSTRSR